MRGVRLTKLASACVRVCGGAPAEQSGRAGPDGEGGQAQAGHAVATPLPLTHTALDNLPAKRHRLSGKYSEQQWNCSSARFPCPCRFISLNNKYRISTQSKPVSTTLDRFSI